MRVILLSGGSGKRLWPLSNEIRSKQFIKFFKTEGGYESMVQRVYNQIKTVDSSIDISIATSKSQVSSIYNQLGDKVTISVEPCRKDTFPAIALAVAFLHDVQNVSKNEVIVVCPVDPYVEEDYYETVKKMGEYASLGNTNIVLMGIKPTYPSEKYGYIIPKNDFFCSEVSSFVEKPSTDCAKKLIKKGALWNGGVFAFKCGYLLDLCERLLGTSQYKEMILNYKSYKSISFDYAVVEKEDATTVLRFDGKWMDIGSWNTLVNVMSESIIGDATTDSECSNTHIINELDIPILAMGIKDIIVSASPDGILVSEKGRSDYIKPFVERIQGDVRFAEKSWGCFKVIDVEENGLTIKVTIKAGDSMNYHSHSHRDEVWIVVSGNGETVLDGIYKTVKSGDVITIPVGCKHTIRAITELVMIEVQIGKDISVHDKQKHELPLPSSNDENRLE